MCVLLQADFAARESGINSMAFSPRDGGGENGVLLATGGEDCTLRVWELSADRSECCYGQVGG